MLSNEGLQLRRAISIQAARYIITILIAGERCHEVMNERIKNVPVKDVEADEMWAFVGMKKMTKLRKQLTTPQIGDAYTFVGIERNTKLVLAWHLGDRDTPNTEAFTEKLDRATSGYFQLTTDGMPAYPNEYRCSLI